MAIYAIGDVQGCFASLKKLIDLLAFNPARDRLWFVGDLVNRGPDSLGVLRYIKSLGSAATTVLGNHDIHLLAVAAGIAPIHRKDTIQDVLSAPDAQDLLGWVRRQPILHREAGYVLVHAGLLHQWTTDQAMVLAKEVEEALRSQDFAVHLAAMYRSRRCAWAPDLSFPERLGITTNVLVRLRVCSQDGLLNLAFKGPPEEAPPGYYPWYQIPTSQPRTETIIFGHWSALGILVQDKHIALDGGCVWGHDLVAIRLEDRQLFRVSCSASRYP